MEYVEMEMLYSIDFEPETSPPQPDQDPSDSVSQPRRDLHRNPTLASQALKRLKSDQRFKSNRVNLDTARTVAAALLTWPPRLTAWEVEFLHSAVHCWRRDPTTRQLRKLRQITRNPMAAAIILRRLMRAGQRSRRLGRR
jgi:hypothetical protein